VLPKEKKKITKAPKNHEAKINKPRKKLMNQQ
jgi:hypothetical protein